MADVLITEFTDPGCAWAYSAEPFRQRLHWLYGDSLEWRLRVVGPAKSPADYEERHFSGQLLDEESTLRSAAQNAGLGSAELDRWIGCTHALRPSPPRTGGGVVALAFLRRRVESPLSTRLGGGRCASR